MHSTSSSAAPIDVIHVVDAAGGNEQLWGKERVVQWLMEAQAASGDVVPRLRTLSDRFLTQRARETGIDADSLANRDTKDPRPYARALKEELRSRPTSIVHTHGYKANLIGRLARLNGAPMKGLVSTCHGWVDNSRSLRFYNWLDRQTSSYSDVVTVPAPGMLDKLKRNAVFVPNGIPDAPPSAETDKQRAREVLGLPKDKILAGTLGRLSPEKGLDVLRQAVSATRDQANLAWVVAGTGPLEEMIREAASQLPNLHFIGYVDGSSVFLPAMDIFVQPSWSEGLSLALLEAARDAKAIVATRVGATDWAVRDPSEALLVEAGDAGSLARYVQQLAESADTRRAMGQAARRRFDEALSIEAMHQTYLNLYRTLEARPTAGRRRATPAISEG